MSDLKTLLQEKLRENRSSLSLSSFLYYPIFTKKWMEMEM